MSFKMPQKKINYREYNYYTVKSSLFGRDMFCKYAANTETINME